MTDDSMHYQAIMVSSTFTDLEAHRRALIDAINGFDFKPNVMEHDGARADTNVIQSSLRLVRNSAAYVGVISHKYGQTPIDPKQNPAGLSITELEFNEAQSLSRPTLLFIMADDHPVTKADVEQDTDKQLKLDAFRVRAKRFDPDSEVERIYEVFSSLEDFTAKAIIAIGKLAGLLNNKPSIFLANSSHSLPSSSLEKPNPPELRAIPRYLGSHRFLGREAEQKVLDDWADGADPNPFLLFEAIGGSGKSILTWHWLNSRALIARSDWTGRFWYSFYERGATMSDFCREALSYISGEPLSSFAKMRSEVLSERLLAELDQRPWLLVLDGLERILVEYHRIDAAQIRDEEVDSAGDPIINRDPCRSIRPEDDDLLRALTAVKKGKILATSRLMPAALISHNAGTTMPGILRVPLRGLTPENAEALFKDCGVRGKSESIRNFLQRNCDCHPLVIGALAGLVKAFLPDRGNFDAWVDHPAYGGALTISELDLVQKRNHILDAAIKALPDDGGKLLGTLALLLGSADYDMLLAFNPHLPPHPEEIAEPKDPETEWGWRYLDDEARALKKSAYGDACEARSRYLEAERTWQANPAVKMAPQKLRATVLDLERRGLLQYDGVSRRYDLHPVVRGIASASMAEPDQISRGQQVLDFCMAHTPDDWETIENLEEMALGFQIVATLTRVGRYNDAIRFFRGPFSNTLTFNLEAYSETLALLKRFFPDGWDAAPVLPEAEDQSYLLNALMLALPPNEKELIESLVARKLQIDLYNNELNSCSTALQNLSVTCGLSGEERLYTLALAFDEISENQAAIFVALLYLYSLYSKIGNFEKADLLWARLAKMERPSSRAIYRYGTAEADYAWDRYRRGELTEAILQEAEALARDNRVRTTVRTLHFLRGKWLLERGENALAVESLAMAVRLAHEARQSASQEEAVLALAKLRNGDSASAFHEAERMDSIGGSISCEAAQIFAALGHNDRAVAAALRAHKSFTGEGEPYVWRHELNQVRSLLAELGAKLPEIPLYDPSKHEMYVWELDIRAHIEKLRAEKAAETAKNGEEEHQGNGPEGI